MYVCVSKWSPYFPLSLTLCLEFPSNISLPQPKRPSSFLSSARGESTAWVRGVRQFVCLQKKNKAVFGTRKAGPEVPKAPIFSPSHQTHSLSNNHSCYKGRRSPKTRNLFLVFLSLGFDLSCLSFCFRELPE